jgi:hypothetical protein
MKKIGWIFYTLSASRKEFETPRGFLFGTKAGNACDV